MISTVSFNDFCDSFGGSYKDNFSYEGKRALFDYLEEYEESTGEQMELDPIAFCCDFTEYKNMKELKDNYSDIKDMDDLKDHTTVIEIEGTDRFIIQDF
jgi:hypothetical protein